MKDSATVVGKTKATSKRKPAGAAAVAPAGAGLRSSEGLHQVIAVAAYYFAERRNFEPGHETDDWLSAEAEVLAGMKGVTGSPA